jgi:mannosyltransferase
MKSATSRLFRDRRSARSIDWSKSHIQKAWISLTLLIATVLRLYQLNVEGVWIDEMFSMRDAENFNFQSPSARPLYYMLLRLWMFLGEGDAWLRGFSVLCGLVSVLLVYQLGRRLIGELEAQIAALVMALSPLFINHAQEIRMYTFSTVLTLGGTLALAVASRQPNYLSLGTWSLMRYLAIITTPLNVTLLLPDCLLWGWKFRQNRRWLLVFGAGLLFIGLAWSPLVVTELVAKTEKFVSQHSAWEDDGGGIKSILSRLTSFTVYWPLKDVGSNPIGLAYYMAFTLVLLLLLGAALWAQRRSEGVRWIAAWGLLPAIVIFVASQTVLSGTIWRARYLLFVAPYLLLLFAVGFAYLWRRQRLMASLVALAYVFAVGGGLHHYYTTLYREDWHGALQMIESQTSTGDVMVQYSSLADYSLPRYYQGSTPFYVIDKPQDLDQDNPDPAQVQQLLSPLPTSAERLWLVCWLPTCQDQPVPEAIAQRVLGDGAQVEKQEVFKHESSTTSWPIEVVLLTPRN